MQDSTHPSSGSSGLFKKLFYILSAKEKKSAVVLLLMLLLGMILEMFSLSLVIPMIIAITKIETLVNNPYLAGILKFLGNPSQTKIIKIILGLLVGAYSIKTFYLLYLSWRQSIFSQHISMNLSKRLFNGYLKQPYNFHLQRNSSELYRNVLGEVDLFTSVIQAMLLLQTNISIFLGIFISILIVEPAGACLIFSFFVIFGFLYFRLIRKMLLRWGNKRQQHDVSRSKHLMQGLGGVKDIKILGREDFFIRQFEFHNKGSFDIGIKVNVFQQAPRLLLELLAIVGLAIFLAFVISMGRPLYLLLPILGVCVVAAFRLIPAVGSVMSAVQTMRYANAVIDLMYREIKFFEENQIESTAEKQFKFENRLRLKDLSFRYPGAETVLLKDVNLEIAKNEMVGLIGESGAGKSTLVDIILGFHKPISGIVEANGIDISTNMRGWQRQIGYVPQTIYLTDDTIAANIAFGVEREKIDNAALQNAIDIAQLNQFVNDLPDGIFSMVGERGVRISGGQRQRIGIARALYHNPEVLILDEATSSLDVDTERWVMEAINQLQHTKTILIITHRLSTVERCDTVYKLEKGELKKTKLPVNAH